MSATEYSADMRDIHFMLFEQLKVQELCNYDAFKDFDRSQFEMIIDEAYKFARNKAAPLNQSGDRVGCTFKNGEVTTPEGFKELFQEFSEMGWVSMASQPEYDGQGLPTSMSIAAGSFFTGANVSFSLYGLLCTGVIHVLETFGTEAIKHKYIPPINAGRWSGTMVLTEPNAGSDVGNSKASAQKQDNGLYKIKGSKIFITGGDHDLTENIIHLVLARAEGAPAGTKGLSLFIVPKYKINEDGSSGELNDVVCSGIEHKMGIKASSTCALNFGDDENCEGELIGSEGDGIKIMFHMMNEARIDCGVQGAAQSAAAFRNALSYAQERYQGSSLEDFKNPEAPRVTIDSHPDVRRMLLSMKAQTEGMNALLYYTARLIDVSMYAPDDAERKKAKSWVELLTPICKAYCSDTGFNVCSQALQIYGGYGYTQEYPAEQYLRDVRIAAIYEGTNGIQAMDLLARKLPMGNGAVFRGFLDEIEKTAEKAAKYEQLSSYADRLKKTVETLGMAAGMLATRALQKDLAGSLLWASPFLMAFGTLAVAHQLLDAATIASAKLAESELNPAEKRFYSGKVKSAQFFIQTELHAVEMHCKTIMDDERAALEVEFETLAEN